MSALIEGSPITLTATLEDPTPNATGLVKVRFERPEGIVFAWVPAGAVQRLVDTGEWVVEPEDAA